MKAPLKVFFAVLVACAAFNAVAETTLSCNVTGTRAGRSASEAVNEMVTVTISDQPLLIEVDGEKSAYVAMYSEVPTNPLAFSYDKVANKSTEDNYSLLNKGTFKTKNGDAGKFSNSLTLNRKTGFLSVTKDGETDTNTFSMSYSGVCTKVTERKF